MLKLSGIKLSGTRASSQFRLKMAEQEGAARLLTGVVR